MQSTDEYENTVTDQLANLNYQHEMHLQNKVAENDEVKANLFNQYFQSVF